MKKARTILAIMLALFMVLSVLPASFAEDARKTEAFGERTEKPEQTVRDKTASRIGRNVETLDSRLTKSSSIDADTEVTVIVVFDEPALSDEYTADEIRAKKADAVQARLNNAHDVFFKSLSFEAKRGYDYTALLNGMSLTTAYKNVAAIEKMSGVHKVYLANFYNAPEVQQPTQLNANIITGAADMQDIKYKGEGMVVAVLDTGLNLTHEAFQDYGLITDPAFTQEYVESVETTVEGKYVSIKVPFAYDYYHQDDDATDYRGHGSHVAGTIAGYAEEADGAIKFSGAAPAAQICFMKIFSDTTGGTNSAIYAAALEDAYRLGVDAINMSLGSPGGFVYDPYVENEVFGNVYKKIDEAGIINCCSAGNEYSMAYNNGNIAGLNGYQWVLSDYADYGLVGTPSSYAGNLSIAAAENFAYPTYVIQYEGSDFSYSDTCEDGVHGWLDNFAGEELEVVDCGLGKPEEIPDEVEGKVALIIRGELNFSDKVANAAKKGAIGAIVYNNTTGSIGMSIPSRSIPAISITQAAGQEILAGLAEGKNTVFVNSGLVEIDNENAWLMSTFSSWGCTPSLELKPTISAPGGMIYSSVNGASDAYEVYSGTSMAAPNSCGSFLVLSQYLKDTYPTLTKLERARLAEQLAESTARIWGNEYGTIYSPRKMGSGVIDIDNAISTPVYVQNSIVNLYDDPDKTGVYNIEYTLVNLTDSEQIYKSEVYLLYDYVQNQGYNMLFSRFTTEYYGGITVTGDTVAAIPANGTFHGTITVTLSDDLKAQFDAQFANGNFVEGFIFFYGASEENAGIIRPTVQGLYGDANLDNRITAADAAEVLRSVVGLTTLSPEAMFLADVDGEEGVTASDATYLLQAVVGLTKLPTLVLPEEVYAPEIHQTFMGFYGDWAQAPVLDKIWTNDASFLMYLSAMFADAELQEFLLENYDLDVLYYAMNGVLPTDLGLWAAMEPNLGPIIMYGTDSNIRYAYNYIGRNPATVLLSDEDIVLDAWAEYFSNDEYTNPLHTAITNYKSDGDEYFVENFFVQPLQLRNVRHLIMTVTDATTDEIYYVDDTEYLPKAYFDSDYAAWSSYGSFYWDGYVENEESELYGTYVPNGTVCLVKFETQIDYEDAPLKIEKQFQLIVDTESVKVTGIDIVPEEVPAEQEGDPATTKPVMTISVADNGSGVAFADAYYFDEAMTAHDLDIIYADGDLKFDMADMPESNPFIVLETLDYATNYKSYTINVKTKELVDSDYEIGTVEFVASQILAGENLGTVQSIQAFITDVYDGVVYVAPIDPMDPEGPSGMMVQLSNPKMAKFINVGDAMVFGGTLDLVNGCPCLTDAEIGDLLWDSSISDVDLMYYYVIYYMMWDWPDTLEPIVTQPELYVGGTYYLEDLLIIDITENDDGTLTLTVTDGDITIDIVHTTVADDAKVGDMVYVGIFVPVFDQGELALRVVYDSPDYIVIVPADD